MDAPILRSGLILTALLTSTGAGLTTSNAAYRSQARKPVRTTNFVVYAPTDDIAAQVGRAAEYYRVRLARRWLGRKLPDWSKPCPVRVKVGQIGAGGKTTFQFRGNRVFNWDMEVQGSLERILDSVLPHEINHTVLASHFRRPLPRWADEGAATLCEHESERMRQTKTLAQVIRQRKRFPMRTLLSMKEYPRDMRRVLTLYAQGYSLTDFLVQQGGHRRFLQFLSDAHEHGWNRAIERNYNHTDADSLETHWQSWFIAGSPRLTVPPDQLLANAETRTRNAARPNVDAAQNDRGSGHDAGRPSDPRTRRSMPDERQPVRAPGLRARPSGNRSAARFPESSGRPDRRTMPSTIGISTLTNERSVFCLRADTVSQFLPGRCCSDRDQSPRWSWLTQRMSRLDSGSGAGFPSSP